MDFIEQQHQESKQTKEELVTLNSKTTRLSEPTEAINEIPVNLSSEFIISKITTLFNEYFDRLSMNIRIGQTWTNI